MFVDRVFISFVGSEQYFSSNKTLFTGNPIRADFFDSYKQHKNNNDRFTLLVFGGSQGAIAINQAITSALPLLKTVKDKIRIIHQCGKRADIEAIKSAYHDEGFLAEVTPFIDDMASAYANANLIISRAGATTIAEITAIGKASILIPFPYAVGNHQKLNALRLVEQGAAVMVEESATMAQELANLIVNFLYDDECMQKISLASVSLGMPNASKTIVNSCMELCESYGH